MGCDIHGIFQKRSTTNPGTWEFVEHGYEFGRHYQLFAVLADVRNGHGFAGIKTGDCVTPISEPRGFPDDWTFEDEVTVPDIKFTSPRRQKSVQEHPDWYKEPDDSPLRVWLGDHSHSWLTSTEMLAWYENAPTVEHCGVISKEEYDAWDGKTAPDSYCDMISGPGVVVSDYREPGGFRGSPTHVRVYWQQGLKEELGYFFEEIARLHAEHGEVRMVFGFDS